MSANNAKALPKCVSVNEAAELLGLVPLTIRRLIKAGKLRASHVGRRVIVKAADVVKYLADNEVRP
jgi:excisionase family DNA binding protein